MAETTQINKYKQKRSTLSQDTFLYPTQSKLYTKEEFELLDSIYSDGSIGIGLDSAETAREFQKDNFWVRNKQELLALQSNKSSLLNNAGWFTAGMMLTSVAFLIYFQMNGREIKQKQDIQIIFQKSTQVMTDKTADEAVSRKLESNEIAQSQTNTTPKAANKEFKFELPKFALFTPKAEVQKPVQEIKPEPVKEVVTESAKAPIQVVEETSTIKHHVVRSGDSLWIIANKYYSNPSQENIKKIMRANNIRSIYSTLRLGQKLVIPS
jgi:hypothetical protein